MRRRLSRGRGCRGCFSIFLNTVCTKTCNNHKHILKKKVDFVVFVVVILLVIIVVSVVVFPSTAVIIGVVKRQVAVTFELAIRIDSITIIMAAAIFISYLLLWEKGLSLL